MKTVDEEGVIGGSSCFTNVPTPVDSRAGANDERTVLDYLNAQCWHAVLGYVPVQEILSSERVSRRWQMAVWDYLLSHIRTIVLEYTRSSSDSVLNTRLSKQKKIGIGPIRGWSIKLDPSVNSVRTVYCLSSNEDIEDNLRIIGENRPMALTFIKLPENLLLSYRNTNFQHLQSICFKKCHSVSDYTICQFIANNELTALEELEIVNNKQVTGQCLIEIQKIQETVFNGPAVSNLKSIVFTGCWGLDYRNLLSAADRFSQLTKLELSYVPDNIFKNLPALLDKTPKLELLRLGLDVIPTLKSTILRSKVFDGFYRSVCRLSHLKQLILMDIPIYEKGLEAVSRCCKELETLKFGDCRGLAGSGVVAACRNLGPRLVTLGVARCDLLTDHHVVDCIRLCPNLTSLNLCMCNCICGEMLLTSRLSQRAAAARRGLRARRPLRLNLYGVAAAPDEADEKFEELIIERNLTYI